MNLKLSALSFFLLSMLVLTGMRADKLGILDQKLSMKVHAAETLESVIFRLFFFLMNQKEKVFQ